jgi:hypothetical protein
MLAFAGARAYARDRGRGACGISNLPRAWHGKNRDMIVDDIRAAQMRNDRQHILTLLHVLPFLENVSGGLPQSASLERPVLSLVRELSFRRTSLQKGK